MPRTIPAFRSVMTPLTEVSPADPLPVGNVPRRSSPSRSRAGLVGALRRIVVAAIWLWTPLALAQSFLPLAPQATWTLRASQAPGLVTLDVVESTLEASQLRFRTPWSDTTWRLAPRDGRWFLVGYGVGSGPVARVSNAAPFLDFTRPRGSRWSGAFGEMLVEAVDVEVSTTRRTYRGCIRLVQTSPGGRFAYTFAPGRGLVQFDAGPFAFILDEDASPEVAATAAAPHIPSAPPAALSPLPRHPLAPALRPPPGPLLVGVTTNTMANEASTPGNLMDRFTQTLSAGATYISGAGLWTGLETSPGRYDFQSVDHQVREALRARVPMSYTLRVIDTVHRRVPPDLEGRAWDDPEMERRALRLVEELVPRVRGTVRWLMFGNEIDGYFDRRPQEIAAFASLFSKLRARVKALAPEIAFGTTLMYAGADRLTSSLAPLDALSDVVSLTYYPMQPDFTVQDPGVPASDVVRMRQLARGRGVVLQEIGYPSSPLNGSSPEKQAAFYANMFSALREHRDVIEAASFFVLADLSDAATADLAAYYGIGGAPAFSAFLQTLGMFDGRGRPKPSWDVFRRELAR